MNRISKNLLLGLIFICVQTWTPNLWAADQIKFQTKAVRIGNPSLKIFPKQDSPDIYARSVWDMQSYEGRIYFGCGDLRINRGPVPVWSFQNKSKEIQFKEEIVVDEEEVRLIRAYGDVLLIPGSDAKESWDFGNIYLKRKGAWQKLRTIPHGLHVFDAAIFKGDIYVYITSEGYSAVLQSKDMALTWSDFLKEKQRESRSALSGFGPVVPLKESLVVLGYFEGDPCVYEYKNNGIHKHIVSLFPASDSYRSFGRAVGFKEGVLYTPLVYSRLKKPAPLLYLENVEKDSKIIEKFRNDHVRDIVISGEKCFVLTACQEDASYRGQIFMSRDLSTWILKAEFHVSALPYSMEVLNGIFFIGLGHTFLPDKWDRGKGKDWASGEESGSIWRIE